MELEKIASNVKVILPVTVFAVAAATGYLLLRNHGHERNYEYSINFLKKVGETYVDDLRSSGL